jgi:hypothetical protein
MNACSSAAPTSAASESATVSAMWILSGAAANQGAVLPFVNAGAYTEIEHIADGSPTQRSTGSNKIRRNKRLFSYSPVLLFAPGSEDGVTVLTTAPVVGAQGS